MKKLLFLLLIVTGVAKAQIINIPDPVFKARLIANGCDFSGDGYIQQYEALAITEINISGTYTQNGNIHDLTGIEYFTNIQALRCSNNQLTSLNLSSNSALRTLICSENYLTSLNLNSNTALKELDCSGNQITSLNFSNNNALWYLLCYSNQLTSLNVSSNTALSYLECQINLLTSLNLISNTALTNLSCGSNQLTSLNVSSCTVLTDLDCSSNQLTSLNLSSNTALRSLGCSLNQLTSLNLSSNTALRNLICRSNQLTSLNVSSNTALTSLACSANQLTSLDVSYNVNLNSLYCDGNQLTTLFIKNGRIENINYFSFNPNLSYICADEAQVASVQAQAGTNVLVNSYCTFPPGGNYNTISGTVRFDMNNNGCEASDLALPNSVHLNITDGTVASSTFPITNGSYLLYTLTGINILTTSFENPNYFNITPSTSTITTTTLGNSQTQDFCIAANGVHNDVEVIIMPVLGARPGFDASYKIVYKNKGTQTLSGAINFSYNDAVLDYVSATINPNAQATGSLSWNYTNLLPFESRSFNVVLNVNAPTETPAVNIGDVLNYSATINPISGDETTSDNVFAYDETVEGSFDPNDKTCLEGAIVSPAKIGDYLHYNINFENTGNAAAQNIVVKDIIDTTKFDVNTLQILNTSHAMTTKMSGNKVEFVFQNINLGASQHGNVTFKIKTKNTLVTGNAVANRADIYFDYNFPVSTNTATTTFQTLSSGNFALDNSVKVYPNPVKNNVNINCSSTIKSIALFDSQGRILTTKIVDDSQSNFDISIYSSGVYFVKITTEKGSKVEKIIKE